MRTKYLAFIAPLLAAAAFAAAPSAALAAPHWYVKGARLPFTGAKTAVTTKGTLTLTNPSIGSITCTVKDKGFIWNVNLATAGMDEITEFVNSPCASANCPVEPTVTAEGLPWHTELLPGPPIRDKITGIKVRVICDNALNTVFSGTLTPKFVNNSPSFAEFDSESGSLENTEVGPGTVSGTDSVEGPEGAVVEARNP